MGGEGFLKIRFCIIHGGEGGVGKAKYDVVLCRGVRVYLILLAKYYRIFGKGASNYT